MWLHVVAVKAEHGTIREMRAREPLKPPWPNGKGKSARQQGPTSRWGAGYRATSAAFTRAFGVKGSSLALTSRTTTSAATSLLASRDDHLRENQRRLPAPDVLSSLSQRQAENEKASAQRMRARPSPWRGEHF
jgi:hypothetical protein